MSRMVQAAAGVRGVSVSAHLVLKAGETAVVSDSQWASLSGQVSAGNLLDLGSTSAPVTDDAGSMSAPSPIALDTDGVPYFTIGS